jgi:hypothetical protein
MQGWCMHAMQYTVHAQLNHWCMHAMQYTDKKEVITEHISKFQAAAAAATMPAAQ